MHDPVHYFIRKDIKDTNGTTKAWIVSPEWSHSYYINFDRICYRYVGHDIIPQLTRPSTNWKDVTREEFLKRVLA